MHNKSFSKVLLLSITLFGTYLFLGSASIASATTPANTASYLGCPQVINMDLYQTDKNGTPITDVTGHYLGNFCNIYLATWPTSFSTSISSLPTVNSNEVDWTLDNGAKWSLSFLTPPYVFIFVPPSQPAAALNNAYITGYQALECTLQATAAGTQQIRVTSPGLVGDGSDSVAYTMTIVVTDNSPHPTSQAILQSKAKAAFLKN